MKTMTRLTLIYLGLFFLATVMGTLLLYLPFTGNKTISIIDAFFISTSAFTVTGLSTVDIPSQFNNLGYFVIMILIQIGGIGIVTLTIFILILSRRKVSFKSREILKISWNNENDSGLLDIALKLVVFSVSIELIGFLLLDFQFIPEYGFFEGSYKSLFTSISAFNNAGFSLFSDSLMKYRNNFLINIIVSFLIIIGGIGYIVILDLFKAKKIVKLKLHTKIILFGSFVLIIFGTFLFWGLEYNNTLKGLDWYKQLLQAFFQSVTTRTAGFNTVDIGLVKDSTLMLIIFLMFIGASPMSAGGGIKVSTFTLVLVYIFYQIRGIKRPHLFKRSINLNQLYKSLLIFIVSIFIVIIFTFLLLILNPNIEMKKIFFEVVSAFGTVGLSTGITGELHAFSKILIIILMVIGKIGVLILLSIFSGHPKADFYYAEDKVQL